MRTAWISRDKTSTVIQDALKSYNGGVFPELKSSHWLGRSEELTREHIMTGCLAFIFSLNLSSGNSGGKNIYDLLDLYLRNEDVTEEINSVLTRYGVKIF